MSKIKFINEFNAIMEHCKDHNIPYRERMMLISIFYVANSRAIQSINGEWDWPDGYMPINNREMESLTSFDKRSINEVRKALHARGLIEYIPGLKQVRPPMYKLKYLTLRYINAPKQQDIRGQVRGKNAPKLSPKSDDIGDESAPKLSPFYIDKNNYIDKSRGDTNKGLLETNKDIGWGELL